MPLDPGKVKLIWLGVGITILLLIKNFKYADALPRIRKKRKKGNPRLPQELSEFGQRRLAAAHLLGRTNPCTMSAIGTLPRIGRPNPLLNGLVISEYNNKLGKMWNFSLTVGPPIDGGSCPGASDWCRRFCYAARGFSRIFGGPVWAQNFEVAKRPDFANRMIDALRKIDSRSKDDRGTKVKPLPKVFRIHVGGDFFSTRYVQDWIRITRTFNNWLFYGYTRTWRPEAERFAPGINKAVDQLRSLPNVEIMASTDPATGAPPKGWREAGIDRSYTGQCVICPNLSTDVQENRARKGLSKKLCFNCLLCARKGAKGIFLPAHDLNKEELRDHNRQVAALSEGMPTTNPKKKSQKRRK